MRSRKEKRETKGLEQVEHPTAASARSELRSALRRRTWRRVKRKEMENGSSRESGSRARMWGPTHSRLNFDRRRGCGIGRRRVRGRRSCSTCVHLRGHSCELLSADGCAASWSGRRGRRRAG